MLYGHMSGFDWVVPMPIIGSNPVKIHLGQVKCEIFFQITREYGTHVVSYLAEAGQRWLELLMISYWKTFWSLNASWNLPKYVLDLNFFWVSFKSLDFLLEIIWGKSATQGQIWSMNQKAIYFSCINTIVKSSKFQLFLYKVKVKKMSILFFVARKVIVFMEIQVSFLLLSFA